MSVKTPLTSSSKMIVSTVVRSAGSGGRFDAAGGEGAGVNGPFHGEPGAQDADFAVAAGGCRVGDDFGDVQARDRIGVAVEFERPGGRCCRGRRRSRRRRRRALRCCRPARAGSPRSRPPTRHSIEWLSAMQSRLTRGCAFGPSRWNPAWQNARKQRAAPSMLCPTIPTCRMVEPRLYPGHWLAPQRERPFRAVCCGEGRGDRALPAALRLKVAFLRPSPCSSAKRVPVRRLHLTVTSALPAAGTSPSSPGPRASPHQLSLPAGAGLASRCGGADRAACRSVSASRSHRQGRRSGVFRAGQQQRPRGHRAEFAVVRCRPRLRGRAPRPCRRPSPCRSGRA